ncbi:hypothetical protein NDU88_003754 [Pleurodeles waltl]|uniref:Uncharacterized protein n=1 Tax=Pleurodeles waltl TaxID=8319 RepID=A0AAV7MWI4_PLEWA|nr:hypothetical protein NDU88_003754 [Pleurodeles waltl]
MRLTPDVSRRGEVEAAQNQPHGRRRPKDEQWCPTVTRGDESGAQERDAAMRADAESKVMGDCLEAGNCIGGGGQALLSAQLPEW